MIFKLWPLLKDAVLGFINDEALSRGAAMAFFAVTSLAPIVLIIIAIAGLVFGREAAQHALAGQLNTIMGQQSADFIQSATANAANQTSGTWAAVVGLVTLLLTASGVFGEMQSALNVIWKAEPKPVSVEGLIRARAISLGLVAALGFLLIASLAISAAISAFGQFLNAHLPFADVILLIINELIALTLIALLFSAIYKVLPDRRLSWRDVGVSAIVTALLFTAGKSLIGWYLGSSAVASSYGAASALLVTLLWVYYSSLIFLFGAEITRAYSIRHGTHRRDAAELSAED